MYFRESDELEEGCHLISNVKERLSLDFEEMKDKLPLHEYVEDEREKIQIFSRPIKQYQHILETLKKFNTMAIQDDEHNWKQNNQKSNQAKLMLIDQADYGTLHIFFDDRAHEGDDCIVDVRDAVTQEQIPYENCKNVYVVKVEPHRAILEGDYFIKQIEMVERNRDDEIDREENALPEA